MTESTTGILFDDAIEMLLFLDDSLFDGTQKLWDWQRQFAEDFAQPATSDHPFRAVVRAANGSGKDRYIVAPNAMWLASRYPNTTCVVTSASGTQLDRQTNAYIKQIAEAWNKRCGQEIWKINYRHYENLLTKSTIELFVTDEAGRAEGWHPVVPNANLAIFVSEAKSVPEEIFTALARCTGFTYRVDVSSPGLPVGHFFNRCTTANKRTNAVLDLHQGWIEYHITAYDCPHLSKQYIEDCKLDYGGENSWLFKTMVLAEFGTTDDMVVIGYHKVWNAINNTTIGHLKEQYNIGGLDLSAGGDETVLVVRNGNKVIAIEGFRFEDTAKTVDHIEHLFRKYNLITPESYVYGDAGGLGKPILDQLRQRGWSNIRYVLNQSKPSDQRVYANRAAELWFQFNKLLENREILLPDDKRLREQLSTRYYKQTDTNKIQLESKLQARSKGHPSPDRADAVILTFSNYKSKIDDESGKREPAIPTKVEPVRTGEFTMKDYVRRDLEKPIVPLVNISKDFSVLRMFVAQHNAGIKSHHKASEILTAEVVNN